VLTEPAAIFPIDRQLKRKPDFKTLKILRKNKIWSWVQTGHETRIDCAGENQLQFIQPIDRQSEV
jgi:hypothetical protein